MSQEIFETLSQANQNRFYQHDQREEEIHSGSDSSANTEFNLFRLLCDNDYAQQETLEENNLICNMANKIVNLKIGDTSFFLDKTKVSKEHLEPHIDLEEHECFPAFCESIVPISENISGFVATSSRSFVYMLHTRRSTLILAHG